MPSDTSDRKTIPAGASVGAVEAQDVLADIPALRLTATSKASSFGTWIVLGVLLATVLTLTFAPWQQTSFSRGKVVAYSPMDREQIIEAPIKGRVVRWHVIEGQRVTKGQLLAEIKDVDPRYNERLEAKRVAANAAVTAAKGEAELYTEQEQAYDNERKLKIKAARYKVSQADQKVKAAKQKVEAAKAALYTSELDLKRQRGMFDNGLVSKRKLELAELYVAKARTEVATAEANVTQARAAATASRADLLRADAEGMSKIAKARASRRKALSAAAEKQQKLQTVETDISRQEARQVRAPRTGTLLKVEGNLFGKMVKTGSKLAVLIPDTDSRAVQLYVKGNDMPLVKQGRKVRLAFEGWPAVQFVGWPSVAVGTFGGKVAFIDAMNQEDGSFRILVVPDPDDQPWPDARLLRQGSKAKGWVMLDTVPIGWELWRQFNGFPASVKQEKKDGSVFGPIQKVKRTK